MLKLINIPSLPDVKSIKEFFAPSGSKTKKVFKYVYNEKYGCPRRVVNGVMDLDEYIQQSANDVDFKAMGKMLVDTRSNVISHFDVDGELLDVTGLPRDVREYEKLYNKITKEFGELPDGVRELFGNDVAQFRQAWLNGSLGSIIGNYYQSQQPGPTDDKSSEGGDK